MTKEQCNRDVEKCAICQALVIKEVRHTGRVRICERCWSGMADPQEVINNIPVITCPSINEILANL